MKDADKVGELIRTDMERYMMMEIVHVYNMTLKEVEAISNFAKTLYVKNREDKEKKTNEKISDK